MEPNINISYFGEKDIICSSPGDRGLSDGTDNGKDFGDFDIDILGGDEE
jgi:hypothetical protein